MKTKMFFALAVVSAMIISFAGSNNTALYTDVSETNLPTLAVTGPTMDIETGDFDGDGDLDIVLAREFAPNKLLFNNGSGSFTDGTIGNLPQFSYDSEDIGIADFDNDGDLDIVFASEDNAVHELYLNFGNGRFRDASNRLPISIANSVLARDINNDGRPDIILGNAGTDFVLINNGDTTFTDETSVRLPQTSDITQDLKLADIDKDGDEDLIAGNEDGNKIYTNDGNGVFRDETSARLPASATEETRKVSLADIDGDDDLDIFFANVAFRPGRIRQDRLLLNDGTGIFTDVTSTNLPQDDEQTTEGIFVDIDYDNDPDLVTSNIFFNRKMRVFSNNGSGVFTEITKAVLPPNVIAEGVGVKAADLNGDGLLDLYLANRRSAQQTTETDRLLLRLDTTTTGLHYNGELPANGFILHQNYPNPFNPETVIRYTVPKDGLVKVRVFDALGKEVAVLVNSMKQRGEYSVEFDGNDFGGLSSGIYFYKLEAGDFAEIRKMVLIR